MKKAKSTWLKSVPKSTANGCVPAGGQKHTPAFFPPEKKRLMRQLKGEMDNDGNRGMQRPNYSQPRDS